MTNGPPSVGGVVRRLKVLALVLGALGVVGGVTPARAGVESVQVLERTAFAPGVSFAAVGSYEKIRGWRASPSTLTIRPTPASST
jgi:hypothetical protein